MGGTWTWRPQQFEVNGDVLGQRQVLLLDTGASMSIVSPRVLRRINPGVAQYIEENLEKTSQRLVSCSGTRVRCRGVVSLRVNVGGHQWDEPEVYVLDECPHPFIIGWPSLVREDLKLFAGRGIAQFSDGAEFPFVSPFTQRALADHRASVQTVLRRQTFRPSFVDEDPNAGRQECESPDVGAQENKDPDEGAQKDEGPEEGEQEELLPDEEEIDETVTLQFQGDPRMRTQVEPRKAPRHVTFDAVVKTTEGLERLNDAEEIVVPTGKKTRRKKRKRGARNERPDMRGQVKTSEATGKRERFNKRTKTMLPTEGHATVRELYALPPMSEVNVPACFVDTDPFDRTAQYLFEPTPLSRMKDKQWRAAACVVQRRKSGRLYVRVMNPTNEEIVLYAGTPLGTWEHLSRKQVMSIQALPTPKARGTTGRVMSASRASRDCEGDSREEEKESDDWATPEEIRARAAEGTEHLTDEQRARLEALLIRFRFMFRKTPGRTDVVQHVINTGDNLPLRGVRYRQSETERAEVRKQVQALMEAGVVRPSRSPWGASVVLAPKKDGTWRFCVDYRRLNEITVKDVYPLPRIDATLDQLGGSRFFTAMDLTSGFWQVGMRDEDAAKTAFITSDGLYEFTAMPMGLANSPATFQRLMDQVLGNRRFEYALVYLDDVMVHSTSFDDHMAHLESVLECLREASLAVKLKKCSFAQSSTVYLGHVISERGIEPEPAKLDAVRELLPPTDVKGIRMFLGFVGYYRKFIQNFSAVAKPLNALLRKNVAWVWGVEQQDSWEALRAALLTAPILQMPDYSKTFTIRTDASYLGLGACILQGDGESRHPIAYASRSLKPAETRYTATEIECLGMKWAINTFRPYIHGRRFILETDHIALKWLRTVQHTNSRLIRTALDLQQYDMEIVHRPGIMMYDADALSRLRRQRAEATTEEIVALVASATVARDYYGADAPRADAEDDAIDEAPPDDTTAEILRMECTLAQKHGDDVEGAARPAHVMTVLGQSSGDGDHTLNEDALAKLAEERDKDPYYSKLYRQLVHGDVPEADITSRLRNDLARFVIRGTHLYRIEQLYRGGRAQAGNVRYLLWIPEALRRDVLFACPTTSCRGGTWGCPRHLRAFDCATIGRACSVMRRTGARPVPLVRLGRTPRVYLRRCLRSPSLPSPSRWFRLTFVDPSSRVMDRATAMLWYTAIT